ncbi:MAG: aminotransferase class V-fold PLP-dependent enzyme [Bacteroidota bacterium]|jgi:cysteine desulfurase/selenocysteine lyase
MIDEVKSENKLDVLTIRKDFPILQRKINGKNLIYFDSGATSQKPKQVIDSISNFYSNHNSNIHRGVHTLSRESTELYEQARESVKKHLNANDASEIIFTSGTTDSINLVAHGLSSFHFEQGDEIIITEMEHHSNILPWKALESVKGIHLKIARINDTGEIELEQLKSLFSNKTKLLAITHVSNTLGTINPIKEIIALAKNYNVPTLVDGAQAIPHLKIDFQDLDCDFYAFSGHKVYAPTGIGVLYTKKEWLTKFPPYREGGGIIKTVSFEKIEYAESPLKFEAGTPNIEGAIGLQSALDYINSIGLDKIQKHENELTQYAISKLKEIQDLEIYGTPQDRAAVISFNLKGIHPFDVGTILDKMGIAVRTGHHCTQPLMQKLGIPGTVRISFGVYNTKEEIDFLIEGILKSKKMLS